MTDRYQSLEDITSERLEDISGLLDDLQERLEKAREETPAWDKAGSLGYVREQLDNLVVFWRHNA